MNPKTPKQTSLFRRASSTITVVAFMFLVTSDWFQKPEPEAGLFGLSTWVGALIAGFVAILLSFVSTLFLLGVVLKILDYLQGKHGA